MKGKPGKPELQNNKDRWSFIKLSQEILREKSPKRKKTETDQTDNLVEAEPSIKASISIDLQL